ncbi:MAG TPA: FkbM family methyltransferase [Usitatibacter sp.]|nr:FkbM family methyltransferase [Usitatibacter sp.]
MNAASAPAVRAKPRILVCGMPRSMTTWAFNVLRELLSDPEGDYLWIAPGAPEEARFAQGGRTVLAKCHHFSPALAQAADVVVYSYRDVRSAAVSYHRKFGSACSRELVDNWVEAERRWLQFASISLRYEDVEREPLQAVAALRAMLGRKAPGVPLTALADAEVLARVDDTFRGLQDGRDVKYDASTMILPAHRTFQPEPEKLSPAEKAIYDRIGAEFAPWLASHRYVASSDLGQELEYRIARLLMEALPRPVVVDVGVERGSFVELALAAGAEQVHGFEPLPRHQEFLAGRYAGNPRVRIHPLALSDRAGTARFHIATDAQGRELDYHHSLEDLGDSAEVIRSRRAIDVRIAALGGLVADGTVPAKVDFLKVDTDGHDLAVLQGLGELRPAAIMAEYWDTLPESSGRNPFTLAQLCDWASANGYARMLVVRRHGRIELLQSDAPWSISGDWGNVVFLGPAFPLGKVQARLHEMGLEAYRGLRDYVAGLMAETEAKEAEIRTLDAGLREARAHLAAASEAAQASGLHAQLAEKEAVLQRLHGEIVEKEAALQRLHGEIVGKEAEIQRVHREVAARDSNVRLAAAQLTEKEAVIQQQAAQLVEARRQAEAAQREHDGLQREHQALARSAEEKEAVVRTLQRAFEHTESLLKELRDTDRNRHVAFSPEVQAALARGLEEKEAVIQELKKALDAYRAAFSFISYFTRPVSRVIPISALARLHPRNVMPRPRLGTLYQHEPQELVIPPSYRRTVALSAAPKISLVTPSFRQAAFIERTLKSVLDQQYPNLEYFVQDGGSDDGTREILERYSGRIAGWESKPDGGQSQAINLGFRRTSGEIMAWLNSDDILLPGALHCVADFFNRHPDVDVIYGHRLLIDENDRLIGRWILPAHEDNVLSWADYVPQETLFWRRRIWDKAGGTIDESFRFAMDWDLLVRFRKAGARFVRIPRFLGGFRIHPHQKTSAAITETGFKEMDRIRERALGRVPTHTEVRRAVTPYLLRHVACEIGWQIRGKLGGNR